MMQSENNNDQIPSKPKKEFHKYKNKPGHLRTWYRCPGCDKLDESGVRIDNHITTQHGKGVQKTPIIPNSMGSFALEFYQSLGVESKKSFLRKESLLLDENEYGYWEPFTQPFSEPSRYPYFDEFDMPEVQGINKMARSLNQSSSSASPQSMSQTQHGLTEIDVPWPQSKSFGEDNSFTSAFNFNTPENPSANLNWSTNQDQAKVSGSTGWDDSSMSNSYILSEDSLGRSQYSVPQPAFSNFQQSTTEQDQNNVVENGLSNNGMHRSTSEERFQVWFGIHYPEIYFNEAEDPTLNAHIREQYLQSKGLGHE